MYSLSLRRRVPAAGMVYLVAGIYCAVGLQAEGFPAHYLVLEIDEDGTAKPLFYRLVELAAPVEPVDQEQLRAARLQADFGKPLVTLESHDDDELLYRGIVELPRWTRGEFHGAARQQGGWEIDSHRFLQQRPVFAVRVPAASSRLLISGFGSGFLDLEDLASRSDRLPLSSLASLEMRKVARTGNPTNRMDLLIMGDGYTASEAAAFSADAQAMAANFFAVKPYAEYWSFVNVTSLFTVSSQSGADHPPYDASCQGVDNPSCCRDPLAQSDPLAGTYVATAFDGRYCAFGIHRLAVVDSAKALAAAAAVPDWDHILMLLNDETYGGSGGFPPVASTNMSAVDIARHEFGHSFTGLADEYDSANPGFPGCSDVFGPPCEPNVTDESSIALIKWAPWIEASTPIPTPEGLAAYEDEVGLFEGARYLMVGMYRPRDTDCLMNILGVPFGEVCAETYVLKLYEGGWGSPASGIDPIEPGSENPPPGTVQAAGPVDLSVDLLEPTGGLDVSWFVDGVLVAGATTGLLTFAPPRSGSFQVEIRVEDPTPLVHPSVAGTALQSSRQWTVEVTSLIFADGFESGDVSAWSK